MRRIEPAYPDLLPVTHVVRPGYLQSDRVELDPIRMAIVWNDAPRRILPVRETVPRDPVRAIVFARVALKRSDILEKLINRGSSVLLVLDEPGITPKDLGLDRRQGDLRLTPLLPVLPKQLGNGVGSMKAWKDYTWGSMLGLFPFPGADDAVEKRIKKLRRAGASFVVAAPLLLTPKDRHRILDTFQDTKNEDLMENALFHADVSRGLHALERRAGVAIHDNGMKAFIGTPSIDGRNASALMTAARLRLWARRLDQSHEESSWGWRLRRAASALEHLQNDPEVLAAEDNLRVIPGFDPWVVEFTESLWHGGEPVSTAWNNWTGLDTARDNC
jgi:hypothetical protein